MAAGRSSSHSSDDVVIKAPTDKPSYRIVHLPNGLCALLVHDPEIYPDVPHQHSKTLENGDKEDLEEEDEEEEDSDEDEQGEEDEEDDDGEEEMERKKNSSD